MSKQNPPAREGKNPLRSLGLLGERERETSESPRVPLFSVLLALTWLLVPPLDSGLAPAQWQRARREDQTRVHQQPWGRQDSRIPKQGSQGFPGLGGKPLPAGELTNTSLKDPRGKLGRRAWNGWQAGCTVG